MASGCVISKNCFLGVGKLNQGELDLDCVVGGLILSRDCIGREVVGACSLSIMGDYDSHLTSLHIFGVVY